MASFTTSAPTPPIRLSWIWYRLFNSIPSSSGPVCPFRTDFVGVNAMAIESLYGSLNSCTVILLENAVVEANCRAFTCVWKNRDAAHAAAELADLAQDIPGNSRIKSALRTNIAYLGRKQCHVEEMRRLRFPRLAECPQKSLSKHTRHSHRQTSFFLWGRASCGRAMLAMVAELWACIIAFNSQL